MKELKIKTLRLQIRHLRISDLEDFHIYRSNPEVTKYQGFDVMTLKEAEAFIQENAVHYFGEPGQWVQYAIENNETKKIIGDCAIKLDSYDPRIAEIGITISHLEQQKGYAKETLLGIMKFLFEEKDIHRIVEIVDAENEASIKLLESTGFRREGHFIENIFFKGKWGSEFQYAMLQKEWKKL
ncbi:GNAT family N-acetyltransferase [Flavobacterium sp. H4147]|uniref:GNAT family N-acetyltransferase n=1 Tax=Flavobacterium sp. H4147 TaxID=3034149 RepID=UPI0023ED7BC1|nr:GNAT family N-acetyltransferase [Flavobacterium sp. H4147]